MNALSILLLLFHPTTNSFVPPTRFSIPFHSKSASLYPPKLPYPPFSSSSSSSTSCLNAHATQTAWLTGILGKRNSKILLIIGGLAMIKKFLAKGKFIKGSSDGTDEPNWKYVTTDKKQGESLLNIHISHFTISIHY